MDPKVERFAANVRARREEAGISQEELAARSGLNRTAMGLLERGQREPLLTTIVKVANGLDIPAGKLLDGID